MLLEKKLPQVVADKIIPVIYKFTSPTNRVYIGQSWDINNRFKSYKNSKAPNQHKLDRSLKKYGFEAHKLEICHELPIDVTQEVLDAYEIFYWQSYKDLGFDMLNLKEPGSKGKHSEETKLIMSETQKGKKKPEGFAEKISKIHSGKVYSEETRKKMSDSAKERVSKHGLHPSFSLPHPFTEDGRKKFIAYRLGKKFPQHRKYKGTYTFINKDGTIENDISAYDFADKYLLKISSVLDIIRGNSASLYGWKIKDL